MVSKFHLDWMDSEAIANIPDPIALVEKFIFEQDKIIIGGPEKVGKSYLALQWAWEMAHGASLLNVFPVVRPLRVMLMQFEISKPSFKLRYQDFERVMGKTDNLICVSDKKFRIDTPEHHLALLGSIIEWKPDVVIFDPLYYMHTRNENDNSEMAIIVRLLDDLQTEDFGIVPPVIIVIHHMGNPFLNMMGREISRGRADIRGASVLVGWPDTVIEFRENKNGGRDLIYKLRNIRGEGSSGKLTLEWKNTGLPLAVVGGGVDIPTRIVTSIVRDAGGSISQAKLITKLEERGISRTNAYNIVKKLLSDGVFVERALNNKTKEISLQ